MPNPPTILRIKRKRGQDPLQALILEDRQGAKRSKPSSPISSGKATPVEEKNFYFQLTRTDEQLEDGAGRSILNEDASGKGHNFVIPKELSDTEETISNELSYMVEEVVLSEGASTGTRKKRGGSSRPVAAAVPEESEYVYDVYQLSTMTTGNHPKSQIGYIKFFADNDDEFVDESEDDAAYSDHEDSNAEDFYQNDYPEDEDDNIDDDIHASDIDNEFELHDSQLDELYLQLAGKGLDGIVDEAYVSADDDDYMFEEQEDVDEDDDEFDELAEDDPDMLEFMKRYKAADTPVDINKFQRVNYSGLDDPNDDYDSAADDDYMFEEQGDVEDADFDKYAEKDPAFTTAYQRVDYSKIPIDTNDGYVSTEDDDYSDSHDDESDNEANYSDLVRDDGL